MGVSLQVYRSRIGTFLSTGCKIPKLKSSSSNMSNSNLCKVLTVLVLLSGLASFCHVLHHVPPNALPQCNQLVAGATHLVPDIPSYYLDTPSRLTSRHRNFLAKMINGNRGSRGAGIKLLHWNKGPAFLHNKHDEIETIIAGHHPHVLGLSEANLRNDHDLNLVQHENYDLHLSPTSNNPALNTSRVVVYTHQSLVVKRRADLEDNRISAIWLEVGLPHKKKILVCQGYREWKYLGQDDSSSGTVRAQFERWSIFLNLWQQALLEDKEVIVMMDANIDFLKWTKDDLPPVTVQ